MKRVGSVGRGRLLALAVTALGVVPAAASAAPGFERHYELATPPDKASQPVKVTGLSPDGRAVGFSNFGTGNGLPGTESQVGGGSPPSYLGLREDTAWRYFPMGLSSVEIPQSQFRDSTPQQDRQLFTGVVDAAAAQTALFVRRPGGQSRRSSPVLTNLDGATQKDWKPDYLGASRNLSHVILRMKISGGRLLPDDPPVSDYVGGPETPQLYESVDADPPILRRVDVGNDGQVVGDCGAALGSGGDASHAARAVSADGRRIFFSAQEESPIYVCASQTPRDLYARVDGSQTVDLSASECQRVEDPAATPPVSACAPAVNDTQYESASADGERVFFTTSDQLVDSDTDATSDLYMYDFGEPVGARLTQLSAGDVTDPTPGADAAVQGFLRASEDGSRAYFVARGVLTTVANGVQASAVDGGNNLYLATADGGIKFVGTLSSDAESMWNNIDEGGFRPVQLADAGGRYLVFASVTPLTVDDIDATSDIYRYDAQTGKLERVSVGRDGLGSDGNSDTDGAFMFGPDASRQSQASATERSRQVSGDGSRVVFSTTQALEADDVNGKSDVYEWRDGQVRMVSDGRDPAGVGAGGRDFSMSEDGSTVAFTTWRRLLPDRDTDTAADVYVARTGADVDPLPPGPAAPCLGQACQGDPGPSPAPLGAGSSIFGGAGNVIPPVAQAEPTVVRVPKVKTVRGTSTKITVVVAEKGRIQVTGSGLNRSQKTVKKAGTYKLQVRLSKRAQRTLRRKHQVKVRVSVLFKPAEGAQQSARTSVTFKASPSRSSSRSVRRVSVLSSAGREGR